MTILVEFEDGRGICDQSIFINPELVCGVQPDGNATTLVFTQAYNWLVKGDVKEVATKLMLPDILTRAGISLEMLDQLEQLSKEQRNADASKE
jgi:hypothetical protein